MAKQYTLVVRSQSEELNCYLVFLTPKVPFQYLRGCLKLGRPNSSTRWTTAKSERSVGFNQIYTNQFMKVAKELPNSYTYTNLGLTALYLISTLPEEE